MSELENHLPVELEAEMSILLPYLLEKRWEVFEFRYEPQAFGNWYIDFFRSDLTLRLVKDRSQYSLDGAERELVPAGMWRVFTDPAEFQQAIIEWMEHSRKYSKGP